MLHCKDAAAAADCEEVANSEQEVVDLLLDAIIEGDEDAAGMLR